MKLKVGMSIIVIEHPSLRQQFWNQIGEIIKVRDDDTFVSVKFKKPIETLYTWDLRKSHVKPLTPEIAAEVADRIAREAWADKYM